MEVGAQARHGAECGVSGMTIESFYALIQAGQTYVVNQLCEIRRQCNAIGQRMDTSELSCGLHRCKQSVKHYQSTQKDTRKNFFFRRKAERYGETEP